MMIATDRLIIRRFNIYDTEELYRILSNKRVMQYIEPIYNYDKTAAFIDNCAMCEPPKVFAIEQKSTNSIVGYLIYHLYDSDSYEIGWVIDDKFWSQGFASEITVAMIDYAKKTDVRSLVIECDSDQIVTRHIAEKYNFKLIEQGPLCVYKLDL